MSPIVKANLKLRTSIKVCLLCCSASIGLTPSLTTLAQDANAIQPQSIEENRSTLERPQFDPSSLQLQSHAPTVLWFDVPKTSADLPVARFGIFDLLVLERRRHWQVVVALDSSVVAGDYVVYFNDDEGAPQGKAIPLSVIANAKPSNTYDVNPTLNNTIVVQPSWPRMLSALDFLNSAEPNLPFTPAIEQPLEPRATQIDRARSSSRLATALVLLDQATDQLDSQSTTGLVVPLFAPSQGLVANVLATQNGPNLLILDHGRSLISLFVFNGTPQVEIGSGVEQGQVLANIRITPPEDVKAQPDLVWWTSLNGALVSPQHFLDWPLR